MLPALATTLPILLAHAEETSAEGNLFIGFVLLLALVFILLVIASFVFWIMMLVDALRRTDWPHEDQRTLWLVILIASFFIQLNWVAGLIYYFAIKKPLDRGEAPTFFENQKVAPSVPAEPVHRKKPHHKKRS